jgi:hypothetical protein
LVPAYGQGSGQHFGAAAGVRDRRVTVGELAVLRHDEGVRLQVERLVALYAEHGHARADRLVGRAIEELAVRIADMHRHAETPGETTARALVAASEELVRIALDIGMISVARVARDAARATRAGDATAQAAILARLMRIGDRSLTVVWDLQDLTLAPR